MDKPVDSEQAAKNRLFARLDAINRGEVPLLEIGVMAEEAHRVGIFGGKFYMWGYEWVQLRYPTLPANQRQNKFSEYFGLGAKRKALFARLDATHRGDIPKSEIESKEQEARQLGISLQTYTTWWREWAEANHPELIEQISGSDLMYMQKKKRKEHRKLQWDKHFERLDAIDRGDVPLKEIKTIEQERLALGLPYEEFLQSGVAWVKNRHPEIPSRGRMKKFQEYYGLGARKKAAFARWDAIDSGKVKPKDIGTLKQESIALLTNEITYVNWGEDWVALRYPKIGSFARKVKFREYYGNVLLKKEQKRRLSQKENCFARWDAIECNEIPINSVGSYGEEAKLLGVSIREFFKWGEDWVRYRHPDIKPKDRHNKFREYHGKYLRKKAAFTRWDAIDHGEIPAEKIGPFNEECQFLGISFGAYVRWGKDWIRLGHPEVPPEDRQGKFSEYYGRGAKLRQFCSKKSRREQICQLLWEQVEAHKAGAGNVSIKEIAQKCSASRHYTQNVIRKEIRRHYQEKGLKMEDAADHADQLYKDIFPRDFRAQIGSVNHKILERGAKEVFESIVDKPYGPQIGLEQGDNGVIHDILIRNAQNGSWLQDRLVAPYNSSETFGERFGITLEQGKRYKRISFDFLPWPDRARVKGKADKYAGPDTLLFVTLTAVLTGELQKHQEGLEYPDTRVISSEDAFRFLGANNAALDKVQKCCELTRGGKLGLLEAWRDKMLSGTAGPFTKGQTNLEEWLVKSHGEFLRKEALEATRDLKAGQIPNDVENLELKLREAGQGRTAKLLELGVAVTRACQATRTPDIARAFRNLREYPREHPSSPADVRLPPDIRADLDFLKTVGDLPKEARDPVLEVEADMEYLESLARGDGPQEEMPTDARDQEAGTNPDTGGETPEAGEDDGPEGERGEEEDPEDSPDGIP